MKSHRKLKLIVKLAEGRVTVQTHTRKLKNGKRVEIKGHSRQSGTSKRKVNLSELEGIVHKALAKYEKKQSYGTRNEPVHIKYGPRVHFGLGRHGAHYGIYGKGDAVHLYRDRIYVGNAKKGESIKITPEQSERIVALFKKRTEERK